MKNPNELSFSVEDLTDEFLLELTRINAAWVFDENKNPDHDENWIEGKRLTGYAIVDRYPQECKEKKRCLKLPKCCNEYLAEINIQDHKKYKAYFVWEDNGGREDNSFEIQEKDYLEACDKIMSFCPNLSKMKNKCGYNKILDFIDRRKGDRRKNRKVRCTHKTKVQSMQNQRMISDRRSSDRRVVDHRGEAARYFSC